MEYVKRTYRDMFFSEDLKHFRVSIRTTDLDIGVCKDSFSQDLVGHLHNFVNGLRKQLEEYIQEDPGFGASLIPRVVRNDAPEIVAEMAHAAEASGVGPMAAVAGTIAEYVGKELSRYSKDVIVENGGDLYISTTRKRSVGIFAGSSPFTDKIAVEILPEWGTIGLCTSSGTVGPSLSFGKADAAVVIAKNGALADAAATAVGNIVQLPDDVEKGVNFAARIPGVLGAIAIKDDKMAAWGNVRLVSVNNKNITRRRIHENYCYR